MKPKKETVKEITVPPFTQGKNLSLTQAILTAGRFGAIRNEKFVRVEFSKEGKLVHLYDGRWIRPQGRSFSDEAICTPGWEAVENATEIPVEYQTVCWWGAANKEEDSNFALAV